MKILIQIVYLFSLLFNGGAEAGDEIIVALKQGRSSELVNYFDDKVTIKLVTQEDVLSKAQAEANLKYFFEKHPVKTFSNTHLSTVNSTSQYLTGTLETSNGKFRVSALLRRNLISQFRIETDND